MFRVFLGMKNDPSHVEITIDHLILRIDRIPYIKDLHQYHNIHVYYIHIPIIKILMKQPSITGVFQIFSQVTLSQVAPLFIRDPEAEASAISRRKKTRFSPLKPNGWNTKMELWFRWNSCSKGAYDQKDRHGDWIVCIIIEILHPIQPLCIHIDDFWAEIF